MYTTEDPGTRTNQTATRFKETLSERFKRFLPTSEGTHGTRSAKAVRTKFDELVADVKKFRAALHLIRASNPTGVTGDELFSMAIAKHFGKRDGMSYDARSYPQRNWRNHLAFKTLKNHPKFSDSSVEINVYIAQVSDQDVNNPPEAKDDNTGTVSSTTGNTRGELQPVCTGSWSSTPKSSERPIGGKSALRLRAHDKF